MLLFFHIIRILPIIVYFFILNLGLTDNLNKFDNNEEIIILKML